LLQRARAKESEAWQRLVVLYQPLVRHWCRRGGVAAQDQDDVVQEVFAEAFAALDDFQRNTPSDTFRGWLHGVTRHRILEHFRRVRRQILASGGSDAQNRILNYPDLPQEPDEDERTLCGRLYRRALEFIRGEFEARTWQMFWRSVIDGLPTAVVAAELGTSAAGVRQARSRVLRRLREEAAELNLEPSGWTGP
jgi:RNA polymerase sigma-70 factor (ECF subfamily)